MPSYDECRQGYHNMLAEAYIRPEEVEKIAAAAETIYAGRDAYTEVEKATGVPWFWIGAIHMRESDCDFTTHLHNGDPLTGYTYHEPEGRPQVGHEPPFSWEESAIDALTMKGLQNIAPFWYVERMAYEAERYNGFGYMNKGVNSPYVWASTTEQQPGKYVADGVWDEDAWDEQCGVVAMVKQLSLMDRWIAARLRPDPMCV